jgi:hypothetical protein
VAQYERKELREFIGKEKCRHSEDSDKQGWDTPNLTCDEY